METLSTVFLSKAFVLMQATIQLQTTDIRKVNVSHLKDFLYLLISKKWLHHVKPLCPTKVKTHCTPQVRCWQREPADGSC